MTYGMARLALSNREAVRRQVAHHTAYLIKQPVCLREAADLHIKEPGHRIGRCRANVTTGGVKSAEHPTSCCANRKFFGVT